MTFIPDQILVLKKSDKPFPAGTIVLFDHDCVRPENSSMVNTVTGKPHVVVTTNLKVASDKAVLKSLEEMQSALEKGTFWERGNAAVATIKKMLAMLAANTNTLVVDAAQRVCALIQDQEMLANPKNQDSV